MWKLRRATACSASLRKWCAAKNQESRYGVGFVDTSVRESPYFTRTHLFPGSCGVLVKSSPYRITGSTSSGAGIFSRGLATRAAKRATDVHEESASEDFSESDELEDEADDLQDLDEDEVKDVEDEEDDAEDEIEDSSEAVAKRSDTGEKKAKRKTSQYERLGFLEGKAQELWTNIRDLKKGSNVVPILKSWKDEGNEPTEKILFTIIIRLRRIGRYGHALELVEWMNQDDQFKGMPRIKALQVEIAGKTKGTNVAEKVFNEMAPEERTKPVFDALLAHYVSKSNVKKAEDLFQEMEKAGHISGSPFAINMMMRLYKQRKNKVKFQEMLEKAKEIAVEPNIQTYNVMLDLKGKAGDIEGMEKVYEEIKKTPKVNPDAMTYGSLARAYLNAGMHEKAELNMLRLENGSFRRSKQTYEILMSFYGEMGNVPEVDRMWQKCKVIPGNGSNSFLILQHSLAKAGEVERVESMFKHMDNWKLTPTTNARRHNNLLAAYYKKGMAKKAKELEKKMEEEGMKVNVAAQQKSAVAGALSAGESDKALKTVKEAKQGKQASKNNDHKLKLDGIKQILENAASKGDIKAAEKAFEECRKANLAKGVGMWNRLLRAYVKAEVPAYGFTQRMGADKVEPNDETNKLLGELNAA